MTLKQAEYNLNEASVKRSYCPAVEKATWCVHWYKNMKGSRILATC